MHANSILKEKGFIKVFIFKNVSYFRIDENVA